MNEREHLQRQIEWLRLTIEQYRASDLPRSWADDSIARTEQQIYDIEWRLESDPPHPAPICGWKKSYRLHPWPCGDTRCSAQVGMKSTRPPKRFTKTVDSEDVS